MAAPKILDVELYSRATIPLQAHGQTFEVWNMNREVEISDSAALITLSKRWVKPKCPCTDQRLMLICYTQTVRCYLTLKTGVLDHAAAWINFEDIVLGEI